MNNTFKERTYDDSYKSIAWKKIISVALRHKALVIRLLISVISMGVLDIVLPLINSYAISHYFESSDPTRFDNLGMFIGLFAVFVLVYVGMLYCFIRTIGDMEATISYDLRKEAFMKLQELSFSYYDVTAQGWIMARMTSDARTISEILSNSLANSLWGIAQMIAIMIILFIKNPLLALIVLVLVPIMLLGAIILRKHVRKGYREAKKINSEITASFSEALLGSKTTKTLVIEDSSKKALFEKTKNYRKTVLKAAKISSTFGPMVFILGYIGVASILYSGGYLVLNNIVVMGKVVTVSSLYLFVSYTINFFEPVMNISKIMGEIQQATASAERVVSLINEEVEIKDSPEVIEKYGTILNPIKENYPPLYGDVEFRNVTFKYNTGEVVLDNFNLHINKGETIALVGHTGSGKSTIVNLISRFYEPTEGEILIDGEDYKNKSIGWLHSNLGYVLQTPSLFSGSIMDNVKYGNLAATDEEVYNACRAVDVHDFIMSLPEGYNTDVGEGGNRLSLGQKQLISFARAIIANPALVILDEATSSIDTKTEKQIQEAIKNVLKNRTSFVVAHRLSTVIGATRILVLDDGKILEIGTHEELLAKRGAYFELYLNQFKKEKEESLVY